MNTATLLLNFYLERVEQMSSKKRKIDLSQVDLKELLPDQQLKYEIAEELGLLDKVKEFGWKSLTAQETGRIGGLMTKKKRQDVQKEKAKEP
jgi:hypothetical protein